MRGLGLVFTNPKNWGPGPPERQDKVDTICNLSTSASRLVCVWLSELDSSRHHPLI